MKSLALTLCILTVAYSAPFEEDEAVSEATNEDYSYTVMLSMLDKHNTIVKYCVGARIAGDWFITAAECLNHTNVVKFVLTYSSRSNKYLPTPFELTSSGILPSIDHWIHPEYDQNTKTNNIALIKCNPCGKQEPNRIPILPRSSEAETLLSGESAAVTGLDIKKPTNYLKFDLIFIKTKILSPFWCKFSHFSSIKKNNIICASNWGHQGISEADVGAPLVIKGDLEGSIKLVGIATTVEFWSTVFPIPMGFTKVAPYVDWICTITDIFV